MQIIKFSHIYYKMPECVETKKTYLIGVQKSNFEVMPFLGNFISYDTMYSDDGVEVAYYPLPHSDLIILILFTDSEQSPKVWTTIRRYTQKKFEYYSTLVGKQIGIQITNDDSSLPPTPKGSGYP